MLKEKNITITYSDGQADSFTLNEKPDETLLQAVLEQMDRQDWLDIYGDVLTDNNHNYNEKEESN